MSQISRIKEIARGNKKRIVLAETSDIRVIEAASKATKEGIAEVILVGNKEEILAKHGDINLDGVSFIDNKNFEDMDKIENEYYELRKEKGVTLEKAKETMQNNIYFGAMLVKLGYVDGMVAGCITASADVLRPALQIIKTKPGTKLVSAFFLMEVPNCTLGHNGTFIFADSGLNPNPNPDELAEIAAVSAKTFETLCEAEPKVAMLSFSTKGSAKHPDVDKMEEATRIAKERFTNLKLDGTLQLDAAIIEEIAKEKAPGSEVAGHANVLVFPDLDAGNIGYKLVQRLANADAFGPITQGLAKPVNDLSRGCNSDDIVGAIAITAVQAICSN